MSLSLLVQILVMHPLKWEEEKESRRNVFPLNQIEVLTGAVLQQKSRETNGDRTPTDAIEAPHMPSWKHILTL